MTFTKLAWISIPLAFWACTDSTSSEDSWNSAIHDINEGNYGTLIYERQALIDDIITQECKVYATDSKVVFSAVTSSDITDSLTSFSEIDISGGMKLWSEVYSTDPLYEAVLQELCTITKESYSNSSLKKPHVLCSDTAVIFAAESDDVMTLDEIKELMNGSCDNYVKQVLEGSYEKAQSCTVDYEGNIAHVNATYPNKGASVKATFLEGGTVLWEETYTGIDSDLFLQGCESHKDKENISDVLCEEGTLSYRETGIDLPFDKFISALKFTCYTLHRGLVPFEDMLFEE